MSEVQNTINEAMNGSKKPNIKSATNEFSDQLRETMKSTFSTAQEYTNNARDMAGRAGEETVGFIKRHPVNTTIAVGFVGLLAGWLLGRRPRK